MRLDRKPESWARRSQSAFTLRPPRGPDAASPLELFSRLQEFVILCELFPEGAAARNTKSSRTLVWATVRPEAPQINSIAALPGNEDPSSSLTVPVIMLFVLCVDTDRHGEPFICPNTQDTLRAHAYTSRQLHFMGLPRAGGSGLPERGNSHP